MAVPQEMQFFFEKLFDGFWMFEQAVNALTIIVLCHGLVWEQGRRQRRVLALVLLTLSIALTNILIFAGFPKECYRVALLLSLSGYLALYMKFGATVDRNNAVVLWCSMAACMTCVSALAWQGAYLIALSCNVEGIEPMIRAAVVLAQIPCALYLRACDFGEFETVPRSGVLSIVICDVCLLFMAAAEALWIFTSYQVTVIMVVVYACMLMVVISVIYAMYNMCREQDEIMVLQAEHQRLSSEREVAGMVAANIDDLRCLRHDLKNQYAYMSILLREKRYGELEEYFGQMAENLPPLLDLANSGNRSIDTVLNMELAKAKQAFIPVEYDLIAPAALPFSADDLCAILANLLDNAIEECIRLRELGREDVEIRLSIHPHGSYLYIVCRNTTDRQSLERWHDALRTTKADDRLHGYGTRIVMKLARKYNGTADYSLKDGTFVAKVMLDTMEENRED